MIDPPTVMSYQFLGKNIRCTTACKWQDSAHTAIKLYGTRYDSHANMVGNTCIDVIDSNTNELTKNLR